MKADIPDDDLDPSIGEISLTQPTFARLEVSLYESSLTVQIHFVSRDTFDGPGLSFIANISAGDTIEAGELLIKAGRLANKRWGWIDGDDHDGKPSLKIVPRP